MAVIHLVKVGALEAVVDAYGGAIIPKAVEEETVNEGRRLKKPDAELIAIFVKKGVLKVRGARWGSVSEELYSLGLGGGELEALALCREDKRLLLVSNDRAARSAAQVFKVNSATVIQVITAASANGKMSKSAAVQAISNLKQIGWYSDSVIEDSIDMIKGGDLT